MKQEALSLQPHHGGQEKRQQAFPGSEIVSTTGDLGLRFGVLGFWGFGVLGFWGFWGFEVLGVWGFWGFWGFGVSGFRVFWCPHSWTNHSAGILVR